MTTAADIARIRRAHRALLWRYRIYRYWPLVAVGCFYAWAVVKVLKGWAE